MAALTVIVPTFNERENVGPLVQQLDSHLQGIDAEILFVDDSTDDTPEIIRSLVSSIPIRLLRRDQPTGCLSGAVIDGLRTTDSEWVVVMDADLQHPPATVAELYRRATCGPPTDLIVASRYAESGSAGGLGGWFRRSASVGFGRAAKMLFPQRLAGCSDPTTGFFLARRAAIRVDDIKHSGMHVLVAVLLHRQLSVSEIPFQFAKRYAGESKASLREGLRFLRLLLVLRFYRRGPMLRVVDSTFAVPPTDNEKDIYLRGGQKRGFAWLQLASFLATSVSLVGFATTSYWTLIFVFPFGLLFIQQVLATYSSSQPRRITLQSHRQTVEDWLPDAYPSVDIFVPTAGEDLALLENTMHHLSMVRWQGALRISILDDSGRRSVRDMAAHYGFTYFARPTHEKKKAGNLCYAAERTDHSIISILDADFVPRPDYLYDLVPYFDDEGLGIVQSPQFFDTSRSMNWIQRTAGATQELFYRFIQPSRDHSDGAICVGTSALYRRKALDDIGGFVLRDDSEDVWTGYKESKVGYALRYVPILVTKGLCPDNLDSFISQQYRWCAGSMGLLADPEFHTDEDMTLVARLGFWSGFLYYIGTALASLTIPLPVIVMAAFYPHYIRWWNTIWLIGLPILWLVAYPAIMRGRWRMEVLRLQTVYGFAHLFQIVHWGQGRVSSEWLATGGSKRASLGARVRRFYAAYLGVLICVMVPILVWRTAEFGLYRFAGMLVFAGFNLYVVGPLVWSEVRPRRRVPRRTARLVEARVKEEVAS